MEKTEKKPLSMIDALSGGFELILKNPWVLIIPIALDMFVWLGPQISAKPLFDKLVALFSTSVVIPSNASADTLQSIELLKGMVQNTGDTLNVFGVISVYCLLAAGFPTVFGVQPPPTDWARTILFTISDSPTFLVWLILLGLVGILVMTLYLELIARAVRKETSERTLTPRFVKALVTATILTVLVSIGMFGFMVPLSIGATLMSDVSQGIASFLILMGMLFTLWASLYLVFVLPAVFVSGSGAWQAVLNSVSIFRFDFWQAIGLIMLMYLIRWGFVIVWQLFMGNPWGILFDVIANAILGSGLVAATMLFYADRIDWLNQLRERIREQQVKLKGM